MGLCVQPKIERIVKFFAITVVSGEKNWKKYHISGQGKQAPKTRGSQTRNKNAIDPSNPFNALTLTNEHETDDGDGVQTPEPARKDPGENRGAEKGRNISKVAENPTRRRFVLIRNTAKCPDCETTGSLNMSGGNDRYPLILRCKKKQCGFEKRTEAAAATVEALAGGDTAVDDENQANEEKEASETPGTRNQSKIEALQRRLEQMDERLLATTEKVTVLAAQVRTLQEENRRLRRDPHMRTVETTSNPETASSPDREGTTDDLDKGQNIEMQRTEESITDRVEKRTRGPRGKAQTYLEALRKNIAEEDVNKVDAFTAKMGAFMPLQGAKTKLRALYFRGLPKSERSTIKDAVAELLNKWKILNISFVGNSVMELLTMHEESERIAQVIKLTGMRQLLNFDVFANALGNRRKLEDRETKLKNYSKVRARAWHCSQAAENIHAKEWYKKLSRAANRKMSELMADRRSLLTNRLEGEPQVEEDATEEGREAHKESQFDAEADVDNDRDEDEETISPTRKRITPSHDSETEKQANDIAELEAPADQDDPCADNQEQNDI